MASLRQFRIKFDKPSATYEPGEVVSGRIVIDTTREKCIKGLHFIVNGAAFVHWLENDPLDNARSESCASTQEYFSFRQDILSTSNSDIGHKIPLGLNEFSFSFRLPREIPCSFEHTIGYVRYTIKVVIERSTKFNQECKTAFSVISRLDLNAYREKCFAIHDETDRSFKCLCWIGQGSMNVQIMVPCSGYVPGQIITTTIEYMSSPNIPIRRLSTKLLRTVYFRTPTRTMTHKNTLKKIRHAQPFPGNGRMASELLIPPIPPSELQYCNIIDLEYELVVSIHIATPYSKIKRSYPLLIGTVPLYRPALTLLHSACSSIPFIAQPAIRPISLALAGQSTSTINIPLQDRMKISSAHLDIPPPSYQEGLSEAQNIRELHESELIFGVNIPFTPKYPVYNYPAPRLPNEKL